MKKTKSCYVEYTGNWETTNGVRGTGYLLFVKNKDRPVFS